MRVMCFSLPGRIQTRLATLVGPLLLTAAFSVSTGSREYWKLFALMTIVGLILDIGVYGWLIGYQPRWLTLCLAGVEFAVMKWIIEWPYPLEIRLRTRQALEFYLIAWLVIWITLQVVLPVLWPRWAEDGGEFRPARPRRSLPPASPLGNMAQRRRAYVMAFALLGLIALPWLAASIRIPTGAHFTGLLLMEPLHLRALAQATAAARDGEILSLAGVIGWIAREVRWPLVEIYFAVLGIAAFVWILGVAVCFRSSERRLSPAVGFGVLPVLLLPASWLMIVATLIWSTILVPRRAEGGRGVGAEVELSADCHWRSGKTDRPSFIRGRSWLRRLWNPLFRFPSAGNQFLNLLTLAALLAWLLAWARLPTAPLAYLDESEWQALTWLNQSVAPGTPVAAPPQWADWVVALGGHPIADTPEAAMLRIVTGVECAAAEAVFRHGGLCILKGLFAGAAASWEKP